MAGDWIPFSKDLPRKIEVASIAKATGRSRREVVAILLEFWAWADSETADGRLPRMTIELLPTVIEGTDPDFWTAVVDAGWLRKERHALAIPHFERWMGNSAKKRVKDTKRKAVVRKLSASEADKERTTEQDRTEEERVGANAPTTPSGGSSAASAKESANPEKPRASRPEHDELFEVVCEVTASDRTVSSSHVGRVCRLLRQADPPYTPDEVRRWGEMARSWNVGQPGLALLEKNIGVVRGQNHGPPGGSSGAPRNAAAAAPIPGKYYPDEPTGSGGRGGNDPRPLNEAAQSQGVRADRNGSAG